MRYALVLVLVVVACGGGRTQTREEPPPETPPPVETPIELPPEDLEEDPQAIVIGLALGELDWHDYVDPDLGLLRLTYVEEMPNGDPEVRESVLFCGAEVGDRANTEWVAEMLEQAEYHGLECEVTECRVGGGEWEPSRYAIFEQDDETERVYIIALHELSEALLDDEWFEVMLPWVEAEMAEQQATGCGP